MASSLHSVKVWATQISWHVWETLSYPLWGAGGAHEWGSGEKKGEVWTRAWNVCNTALHFSFVPPDCSPPLWKDSNGITCPPASGGIHPVAVPGRRSEEGRKVRSEYLLHWFLPWEVTLGWLLPLAEGHRPTKAGQLGLPCEDQVTAASPPSSGSRNGKPWVTALSFVIPLSPRLCKQSLCGWTFLRFKFSKQALHFLSWLWLTLICEGLRIQYKQERTSEPF